MVHSVSSGSSGSSSESAESIIFGTTSLPTRPPTPPREPPSSPLKESEDSDLPAAESTPRPTNTSTDRPRHRVTWSPWNVYHQPDEPSPQRPSKPDFTPKTILKPFSPTSVLVTPAVAPVYSHGSFPAMLDSVIQALASEDRGKKVDTYVMFSSCLRAYDDKPDVRALKNKMPQLCAFIKRDLFAAKANSGNTTDSGNMTIDTQIIQQAVKLLAMLAWLPTLAESIPESEAEFFISHALRVIENRDSPKILVSAFLHFLSTQMFPTRIMNTDCVGAVLASLHDIEKRISGNTVIQARLQIYKKLMQQNKPAMAAKTADWMEHIITAALSSMKENRAMGMVTMAEAAKSLGSEKHVSRALSNLFNRESTDGVRLFEKIKEQLEEFLKNGEGNHVAQFWGLIILLLRGRPPITSWEYFIQWLQVIQDCYNSPNVTAKVAANNAWRNIIYVLNCGTELTRKNMELLTKPISRFLGITPKSSIANPKLTRQAALANVCALLYYNFRPNASADHISLTWDLIVVGLIEKLVLHSPNEVDNGCKVLTALFDGTHQKPWNESRGLENSEIKAEEVIRLDPKWVKLNSAMVLKTIEVALRRATWEGEDPAICVLWRKFTRTLADANQKEIKISVETMETVAHIFNLFQRLWQDGPAIFVNARNKSTSHFMKRFAFLVTTTFDAIGAICFTEKQLSFDEQNEFVVASTPSNRFSSANSFSTAFHSPVVHLFQLFLKPFPGAEISQDYFGAIRLVISKCLEAQDSRRKGLALLAACSSVLPQRGVSSVDLEAWNIIAELSASVLPSAKEKSMMSPTPVLEFKDVTKILQWGCRHDVAAWGKLFDIFVNTVQEELDDIQVISKVIEPLAKILRLEKLDSNSPVWLVHGKTLLERARYPKSKAVEVTTRVQFGSHRKAANTESFDALYDMIDQFLSTAYSICEDPKALPIVANFIVAVTEFVYRPPATSLLTLLRRIQNGMAMWLTDQKNLLAKKEFGLTITVQGLWTAVTNAITRLPSHDSLVLQSMTVLIASGLESSRKAIVNSSIKTWNASFGKQASLEYPSRVRLAMKKLRPIADISLPAFPEDIEEIVPTPPIWTESQESEDMVPEPNLWSSPTPVPSSRRREGSTSPMKEAIPLSGSMFMARLRGASMPTTPKKPRLKHLDSQIVFSPIEHQSGDMNDEVDSQILTERQKEVRDRQYEEPPSFFPGLSPEKAKRVVRPLSRNGVALLDFNKKPSPPSSRRERSASVDEFVDAPEVALQDAPEPGSSQLSVLFSGEVDVVPSTVFTVRVPARARSESKELEDSEGEEPNGQSGVQKDASSRETPVEGDMELSRYFQAPQRPTSTTKVMPFQKTLPLPRSAQKRVVKGRNRENTPPEYDFDTVPAPNARGALQGLFGKLGNSGEDTERAVVAREEGRTSIQSNVGQGSESGRKLENSVLEIPDSYTPDVDPPEVDMMDLDAEEREAAVANEASTTTDSVNNSIPNGQNAEPEVPPSQSEETSIVVREHNSTIQPQQPQQQQRAATPKSKVDNESESEVPASAAKMSRKPKAVSRRSSTRAKTKPLKLRMMEQEESMLDFITVSKSPITKSPSKPASVTSSFAAAETPEPMVTPTATPRRRRGAKSKVEVESEEVKAVESPAMKTPNARKRKQATAEIAPPATTTTTTANTTTTSAITEDADEPTVELDTTRRSGGRPRKRQATSSSTTTSALVTPRKAAAAPPKKPVLTRESTPAQRTSPSPPPPPPPPPPPIAAAPTEPVIPPPQPAQATPSRSSKTIPPPRSRRTPARSSVRPEAPPSTTKSTPTRTTRQQRKSTIPPPTTATASTLPEDAPESAQPQPQQGKEKNVEKQTEKEKEKEKVHVQVRVDESIIMDSQPELPQLPELPRDILLPVNTSPRALQSHPPADASSQLESEMDVDAQSDAHAQVENGKLREQEREKVKGKENVKENKPKTTNGTEKFEDEIKRNPLGAFKRALEALQESDDVDTADSRKMEDAVFEAYVKLREKRRKREGV